MMTNPSQSEYHKNLQNFSSGETDHNLRRLAAEDPMTHKQPQERYWTDIGIRTKTGIRYLQMGCFFLIVIAVVIMIVLFVLFIEN